MYFAMSDRIGESVIIKFLFPSAEIKERPALNFGRDNYYQKDISLRTHKEFGDNNMKLNEHAACFMRGIDIQKYLHKLCIEEYSKSGYIPKVLDYTKPTDEDLPNTPRPFQEKGIFGRKKEKSKVVNSVPKILYGVFEYVDSMPLITWAANENTREKIEVFIKIVELISMMHRKSLIHGDIKPDNIMVNYNKVSPRPILVDFGFSKNTRVRSSISTYNSVRQDDIYSSPRQKECAMNRDFKDDIYSLGLTLHTLVTGKEKILFKGEVDVLYKFDPAEILENEIREIFLKCTEQKEQKYEVIQELIDDLKLLKSRWTQKTIISEGPKEQETVIITNTREAAPQVAIEKLKKPVKIEEIIAEIEDETVRELVHVELLIQKELQGIKLL